MSEASLAVQGITKLNLELEEKQRELLVSNEKGQFFFFWNKPIPMGISIWEPPKVLQG